MSAPITVLVDARRCDHDPRLICDWCDPFARDLAGPLHRHADGTEHRHGPPFLDQPHGPVVAWLDNGPTYPGGKPEPREE